MQQRIRDQPGRCRRRRCGRCACERRRSGGTTTSAATAARAARATASARPTGDGSRASRSSGDADGSTSAAGRSRTSRVCRSLGSGRSASGPGPGAGPAPGPGSSSSSAASATAGAAARCGREHARQALHGAAASRQPVYGSVQDPKQKARRLARALISDMLVYHPEKRQQGIRDGTLPQLFKDEIEKSWQEYVEQVGAELAQSTPFWTEALNEILAGGHKLF